MGVYIGVCCPAICYTEDGKIKFYNRIHQCYIDKNYTNGKKLIAFNHKARYYKNYVDHCISKKVVAFVVQQNITKIKLEKLVHIQKN